MNAMPLMELVRHLDESPLWECMSRSGGLRAIFDPFCAEWDWVPMDEKLGILRQFMRNVSFEVIVESYCLSWENSVKKDRSIQYRISKIITKVDERNGVSYYQDFTECNLDDAFDALLDYSNRQKRIKKDSDIYWNLIAAAEKIAEKHLGQCR